jgi:hypothetical protein
MGRRRWSVFAGIERSDITETSWIKYLACLSSESASGRIVIGSDVVLLALDVDIVGRRSNAIFFACMLIHCIIVESGWSLLCNALRAA